ncbi:hypothetical protein CS0771_33550 [Catellatospora sp. IY07-71]|nr:hypothetical protein CS0771_33550 [Catellatospora sp. IY07-71]
MGTDALRLGEEDRTIRECVRRSRHRDEIQLVVRHATTVDDVRRALLDDEFSIVHFSGHGTRTGLLFEDSHGARYIPPQDALADLLAAYAPPLECVVLNACYSLNQGEFVSLGLRFTVAMEKPISDAAAITFSEAFYDSIGAGKGVEFSYEQGLVALRLAGSREHTTPVLLRQGETWRSPASVPTRSEPADGLAVRETSALIGIALDVSGSMEDSFDNRSSDMRTRLESVRNSLQRFADGELSRAQAGPVPPVRVFGYAFGLRSGAVCDMFSLLKAADGVMSPAEVKTLADRYTAEMRAQYNGGGLDGLAGLARAYGLGGLIGLAEGLGEAEVRRKVAVEVQRRLAMRLDEIGDTTMEISEFARFWRGSAARLGDAEPLIYGDTPMCAALRQIRDRFVRELERTPTERTAPILLLVSDGEPTDGDPEPIADEIRDLGVAIVSCYLTNVDLASPRLVRAAPGADWPEGAIRLFNMASRLDVDSPLCRHLLREGWLVEPDAACFIQVNHSATLDGFVGLLSVPGSGETDLLPKGR